MKVVYYLRNPGTGGHSLERIFTNVQSSLPQEVDHSFAISKYYGTRPERLLYNMIEAKFRQGDVNHITGDIHYTALLLDPQKTVLTIPDCVGISHLKGTKRLLYKLLWFDIPVRRSRFVTAISTFSASEVCRYVPHATKKMRIVYVPIDDNFIYQPKPFNAKKPVILQFATFQTKNLTRAIKAVAGIPCRLDIIGKINDQDIALLKQLNIEYTNSFNLSNQDLLYKFRACDMVLFASIYEGFGMPIIEANATGRPVVTGNICAMPEVAGNAACLVDPFDTQSIRSGILKVIEDSDYRNTLVQNGLKNVERFKLQNITAQYLDIYKEIFSGK